MQDIRADDANGSRTAPTSASPAPWLDHASPYRRLVAKCREQVRRVDELMASGWGRYLAEKIVDGAMIGDERDHARWLAAKSQEDAA